MVHPLIPQIIELAAPIAQSLGLEVVAAVFQTNQHPAILRVDVRNLTQDTSLDDCERMSRSLESMLDTVGLVPDAYVLEISSPGISPQLTTDRDFISFQGFPVTLTTSPAFNGQTEWMGQLIKRDGAAVHLSQKGRTIAIPRDLITSVQLSDRGSS